MMQPTRTARALALFAVLSCASAHIAAAACGDGVVDGGEQCDLGAGNGSATSCCTTLCEFRAVGLTCRPTAGDCDVIETCNGTSDQCPADGFQPANFVCRTAAGGC